MNNKYEAMFILKPDLSEDDRKVIFNQIQEAVTKTNGTIAQGAVWAERKKLFFPLKRYQEGLYYLLNFSAAPSAIKDIRLAYKLNESILRVLISAVEN